MPPLITQTPQHPEQRILKLERKLSLIQCYIEIDAELEKRTSMGQFGDIIDNLHSRKAEIRRELREYDLDLARKIMDGTI